MIKWIMYVYTLKDGIKFWWPIGYAYFHIIFKDAGLNFIVKNLP